MDKKIFERLIGIILITRDVEVWAVSEQVDVGDNQTDDGEPNFAPSTPGTVCHL